LIRIHNTAYGREELVVELQSNTEEDMANNLERILAWMQQWHKDRDTVSKRKRKAN
jgi:broad-specificity NMP kinase